MAKYKADTLSFDEIYKKVQAKAITYPKFQRNVVWSEKKVSGLIETIQKGYPFGSILLFKPKNENEPYKLIDGLQRFTAISKYVESPLQYYPNIDEKIENLKFKIIDVLKSNGINENDVEVEQLLVKLTPRLKKFNKNDSPNDICTMFATCAKTKIVSYDISVLVEQFIKSIKEEINMDTVVIPVIYFEGDESELTEVFQKINEGGKPLTKYEIFASSWGDYKIPDFKDEKMLNVLRERYEALAENIGELDFDFDYTETNVIDVFEYCFIVSKQVGQILGIKSNNDAIDTIGFGLINACLRNKNKNLHQLGRLLNSWDYKDLIKLKTELLDATSIIVKLLEDKFSRDSKIIKLPSEFQLMSYIANVFLYKNSIISNTVNKNEFKKAEFESILKNIERDILLNIFNNKWGNAGDTKLDDSVGIDTGKLKYLTNIKDSELKEYFNLYMNEENDKESLSAGIKAENKLILTYMLNREIKKNGEIVENMNHLEFEHIVTKKILKENNIKLVSPLCNICYLPEFDNRSKRDKLMYEHYDATKIAEVNESTLDKFIYPSRKELSGIMDNTQTLDVQKYREFLDLRKETLLNRFMELI